MSLIGKKVILISGALPTFSDKLIGTSGTIRKQRADLLGTDLWLIELNLPSGRSHYFHREEFLTEDDPPLIYAIHGFTK